MYNKRFLTIPLFILFIASNQVFALPSDSNIKEINKNHFIDSSRNVHVLGEIQNTANQKIDLVKVNIAYYDTQNNIIGTGFVFTVPSSLAPMQTATYEVISDIERMASNNVAVAKVTYIYEIAGMSISEVSTNGSKILNNHKMSNATDTKSTCDKVILSSFTLLEDLECMGDGLIVGENNIVINLNNHSIKGPGENSSKVGIAVPGDKNVIINGPGHIQNFQAGILVTASAGTRINNAAFEGNKIAIFQTGSRGTTIIDNIIDRNIIGVASHSSLLTQIRGNDIFQNDLAGITIVNTDNSLIEANTINGSRNGIFLDAQTTGTIVANNIALMNDVDLNNADGLPLNINGNDFTNNKCNTSLPAKNCNKGVSNMGITGNSNISTGMNNISVFENNLPPITVGDRQAGLYTKFTPPTDQNQDAFLKLRLFDSKTSNNVTNVNYFLTISKDDRPVFNELFYSKEGPLTIKFDNNQGPVTIYGSTEPFLGGWMSNTGQITASGSMFNEGGSYHLTVEIFGIDNVRNIFVPENAPKFDTNFIW